MLYGIFAFFMIVLSVMGLVHMCATDSYTYIIFPISTLVWGFYKFFKENDDEYCRRNNIKPGIDMGWLLGYDDTYYNQYEGYYGDRTYDNEYYSSHHRTVNNNIPTKYRYSDPEYKKILPRCRRNSLVTTDKVKTK